MNKKHLLGIIISLIFVYFAFRDINLEEFFESMKEGEYIWVLPAFVAMVSSFWLRGYRWKCILNPVKEVSINSAFSATMIGYMANNVLPFRIGDLIRLVAIWKEAGVSRAAALGSIVIERIFDLFMTLAIFGLALLAYPHLPQWAVVTGYAAMGIFVLLIIFSIYARSNIETIVRLNKKIIGKISDKAAERSEEIIRSFSDGLKVIHNAKDLLWLVLLSTLLWLINILWVWFAIEIFDLDLPLSASLLVLIFIIFAVSIPSAPGYVGTFHGFVIAALVFMGVDSNDARASAVVMHATTYIPVTIIGLYYLWKSNFTLKSASENAALIDQKK
ncbi:flippase-like domain-containing protein [Candidatus Marinimicrobia bacterium MT.SAG.4]|nr:flippase-like domain-containing protein [Candidatus Marinimicrobia bacterium MT.SAG.4]